MTQRPNSTIACSTCIAARRLGVSVRTARLWAENGKLKAWSGRGARPRILVSSIDRLMGTRNPATGQGLLIVCEDDERSALAALAGRAVPAMQTDFARDAFDALIRVGAEAPAVVLTHLGLAGMDAFGMLRALAGHAREQGTLVIVLLEAECERAMVRARLPDEVLLLGPTDDIAELAGRLRACVEGRRNRVGTTTAILDDHH